MNELNCAVFTDVTVLWYYEAELFHNANNLQKTTRATNCLEMTTMMMEIFYKNYNMKTPTNFLRDLRFFLPIACVRPSDDVKLSQRSTDFYFHFTNSKYFKTIIKYFFFISLKKNKRHFFFW